jgi:hypothetical protein
MQLPEKTFKGCKKWRQSSMIKRNKRDAGSGPVNATGTGSVARFDLRV